MDQKMKECLTPHALLHTIGGIGIGLILTGLSPSIAGSAVTFGVILVLGMVAGEFVRKPER